MGKKAGLNNLVVFVVMLGMICGSAWGDTIYVKVGGSGGGTSWGDAFGYLQDGLDVAVSGDEIWVAEGTYKPTSDYGLGIGDRGKHFRMINGVGIYGGFDGTEIVLTQRDVQNNVTILSGDIPGENCYHILYHPAELALESNAILDGFTITAGKATGSGDHSYGGGIHNKGNHSPVLKECIISNNTAYFGGGMSNMDTSSPNMSQCNFRYNFTWNYGGGIYNFNKSSPNLKDCIFLANTANYGGGISNWDTCSPIVNNCTFSSNSAGVGGGISNRDSSNPKVTDCTFNSNMGIGSGMDNDHSYPTVNGCTFTDNTGEYGGGMVNSYSSSRVSNCIFRNNWTDGDNISGGGMTNYFSNSIVINCTFIGNSVKNAGGGMYNNNSNPTVINCTFGGNSANSNGGGMYNRFQSSPTLMNCIFWGNTANSASSEIFNDEPTSNPLISYCDISDCFDVASWDISLGIDGGGNIDTDPLFIDPNGIDKMIGTRDDNFRLSADSPCVEAGDNSLVPDSLLTEIGGQGRILDGDGDGTFTVDIGAYEYQYHEYDYGEIIYVNQYATAGANNGISWSDAFLNLQDALFVAAGEPNQIWIATGSYLPTYDYGLGLGDRGSHFIMLNGVGIYGGFPATGDPVLVDRDPNIYATYLSGDLLGNDNPETLVERLIDDPCRIDNCYHVIYHPEGLSLDSTAILDGLTITAGNANWSGNHRKGGGMYNYSYSNPAVRSCIFIDNSAYYDGGGMYNSYYSDPIVTECSFIDNTANDGGGMYNSYYSKPKVISCTFSSNSNNWGGGMCNWKDSNPIVNGCTFTNSSAESGGGILNWDNSSPYVTDCIFIDNLATWGGGICNIYDSSPVVNGCSFIGNLVYDHGGGMYSSSTCNPLVTGCIFSGNTADGLGGGMFTGGDCYLILTGCTFSGNSSNNTGGGMYVNTDTSLTVRNCIFWYNTANSGGNEIGVKKNSTINLDYCNIQGGETNIYKMYSSNTINWGFGNIDVDPLFVDAVGGDLHLKSYSPCIDRGDPLGDYGGQVDLDGGVRVRYGLVDMGAYEVFPIAGDFEGDEDVDLVDLWLFYNRWLEMGCGGPEWCGGGDGGGGGCGRARSAGAAPAPRRAAAAARSGY